MKNYIFLIFALLFSCTNDKPKDYVKPDDFPFAAIDINAKIKNTEAIKKLKNSFETPSFVDDNEKEQKMKTTNVISVLKIGNEKPYSFNHFRCFCNYGRE